MKKYLSIFLILLSFGFTKPVFAGILTSQLEVVPNCIIGGAAPIECTLCPGNLLESALMHTFCTDDLNYIATKMKCNGKFYLAQNNESIRNGSFDMQELVLPIVFTKAERIKINVTMASENYREINGEPELALGIYKDITPKDLSKKFRTQQFLHHYLMKKYKVPLKITDKSYHCGIQKLTGVLNLKDLKFKDMPLQTVVRFTENGFHLKQLKRNPKIKYYAYLIEIEKIN